MLHTGGLRSCSRDELAVLVPEYLLAGHLIDRAGMPYLIAELGLEAMRDVAIEEWMGASPVYTRRMQRALGFEGDSVTALGLGRPVRGERRRRTRPDRGGRDGRRRRPVAEEVAMAGFSTGTDFSFEDRGTPVELRIG